MVLNLLTHRQIEPVGLDIGTSAVKLVRLRRTSDGYAVAAAAKQLIAGGPEDEKQRSQACAEAVKSCFQKACLKSKNAVAGVSGPEVMVRGFKLGPLPMEAVSQAVGIEAQQVCPLDMKHSVLDYQLIESQPIVSSDGSILQPRHGLMTVAAEHALQQKMQILAESGVRTLMIDADALALLNCLNELHLLETSGTVAVVDIGTAFTNVVIYGQDGLPFVRDINIAGQRIVEHLIQTLAVSESQAYGILSGQASADVPQNKALLALNDAIRPLANAINETLRFYSFQEKGAGLDCIYLCGGFAQTSSFAEFLADALPASVRILNPFEAMAVEDQIPDADELIKSGPAFAVAAGLAMRMVE